MRANSTGTSTEHLERALRRPPGGEQRAPTAAERGSAARDAAAAALRLAERASAEGLLDVAYARLDSPFGTLTLAGTERGLVRVAFPEEQTDEVLEALAARVSPRILDAPARLDPARRELEEYFSGSRRRFDLPLDLSLAAPFAQRVLAAAARIPYGGTGSYAQVAAEAGSPRGSRAAGNALGSNPVPIVVPCHRVLRSGGVLGGYGGVRSASAGCSSSRARSRA